MRQVVERAPHAYFLEMSESRLKELSRRLQFVKQEQKAHRIVFRYYRLAFLSCGVRRRKRPYARARTLQDQPIQVLRNSVCMLC